MVGLFDYKYFKWVAVFFGWYFFGLFGAIIAYLLTNTLLKARNNNLDFEISLLRICSMLIKSDGTVEKIEVDIVRNYFKRTFGSYKANQVFSKAKSSKLKEYDLEQLVDVLKSKVIPTQYYAILQLLFAVAASDGKIANKEDDFITRVGLLLQFTRDRIQIIRNQFVNSNVSSEGSIKQYLSVLGLSEGATKDEIKSAYRSLAKEFHPDKLNGMSQGIKDLAKEKFQQIQLAYENLNKSYN